MQASWIGNILVAIAGLLVLGWAYKRGNTQVVKRIVLFLVVQAEKQLGSKTGELKYSFVVSELYQRIPSILRWLVSQREMNSWIEEAVTKLKGYLGRDITLLGYEQECMSQRLEKAENQWREADQDLMNGIRTRMKNLEVNVTPRE